MPIISIQRRLAEQGRIRLGRKVPTSGGRTRPDKLDRFRFTSANQRLIDEIAARYGGTAAAWDNDGKAEWEVITDARAIPVIVVKGGFSQWHEYWTKAGCKHRCDGEKDPAGIYCDPDDASHQAAIEKPTTRLSVMLEEIAGMGVWRMESHGWNAAAELPSMAELAMFVGDLVPATLYLAERSSIIQTAEGPQTSRYVVPGLDLAVTKKRLVEIVGGSGGLAAIEGGPSADTPQLEAARPDYAAAILAATTTDQLNVVWRAAGEAGHLTDELKDAIKAAGVALMAAAAPQQGEIQEGLPVVEVVTWQQVVMAAGERGMTTSQLADFAEQRYAQAVADLEDEQLVDLLAAITSGEAA